MSRKAAFKASKLTPTVFTILEHSDVYDEKPLIYAKIASHANTIFVLDTGCGGATDDGEIEVKSLREFIETAPVEENGGRPLNAGGAMRYIVVLSHCHYDHILAVEHFAADSPILASAHDPSFLSPEHLPAHSLCLDLGIDTPKYSPVLVEHLHSIQTNYPSPDRNGADASVGLVVLHTPGHTPDELALWDESEQMLYVGDTLYEHSRIIFPAQGSIADWLETVDALIDLVTPFKQARIACGHTTAGRPALDVLTSAKQFMIDVLAGREPVRERYTKRGETWVECAQKSKRFSLACPERLVNEGKGSRSG